MLRHYEREFIGLARDWLLCRLMLMGGSCQEKASQYDLISWQIGELDYGSEMRLLIAESFAESHNRLKGGGIRPGDGE